MLGLLQPTLPFEISNGMTFRVVISLLSVLAFGLSAISSSASDGPACLTVLDPSITRAFAKMDPGTGTGAATFDATDYVPDWLLEQSLAPPSTEVLHNRYEFWHWGEPSSTKGRSALLSAYGRERVSALDDSAQQLDHLLWENLPEHALLETAGKKVVLAAAALGFDQGLGEDYHIDDFPREAYTIVISIRGTETEILGVSVDRSAFPNGRVRATVFGGLPRWQNVLNAMGISVLEPDRESVRQYVESSAAQIPEVWHPEFPGLLPAIHRKGRRDPETPRGQTDRINYILNFAIVDAH